MRVSAHGLGFGYGSERLFRDISFSLAPGETLLLTGPSGCGKSTLCEVIAGVIPRSIHGTLEGVVAYDGIPVAEMDLADVASRVAIAFQSPQTQLFLPTVEDELAFGCENLAVPAVEIAARIEEILASFKAEHLRFCEPNDLSGGQQQLVVLMSALIMRPKLLVLDEALSQLDAHTKKRAHQILAERKASGVSLVIVDHFAAPEFLVDFRLDLGKADLRADTAQRDEHEHSRQP